jgi:hypothetical protein
MQISQFQTAMKSQKVHQFALGHLLPILLLVPLVVLYAYDRRMPIEVSSLMGSVLTPKVKEGGILTVRWQVFRYRECRAKISREFVDSTNTIYRTDITFAPYSNVIGQDHWISDLPIPPKAAWGMAKYRSTISYYCGWTHHWQPLIVKVPEITFEIMPPGS